MKLGRGREGGAGREPQGAACGLALAWPRPLPRAGLARCSPKTARRGARVSGLGKGRLCAPGARARPESAAGSTRLRPTCRDCGFARGREGRTPSSPGPPQHTHAAGLAPFPQCTRLCVGNAIEARTHCFKATLVSSLAQSMNHRDGLRPGRLGFKSSCSHSSQFTKSPWACAISLDSLEVGVTW